MEDDAHRLLPRPAGEHPTMMMKATMSGMFDTAVMRWIHQCSAPWPAAPSPFTRASGVRRSRRVSAGCRPSGAPQRIMKPTIQIRIVSGTDAKSV